MDHGGRLTTLGDVRQSDSPQAALVTAADRTGPVEPAGSRAERVAAAAVRWRDELAALGGRDPLLWFRDLKVGTLDLAAAEPEARRRLLDNEPVLTSRLFPYEPLRSSALRSIRAIRDKGRELAEERGISACLLAVGIATWSNPFAAHRPTAPVLLRTASVVARDPAETDFVVEVADDPVVNPVLLHALDEQLGLRFSADDLRDAAGNLRYAFVVERLREFAPPHVIDGFSISHRAVLATFATEPLILNRDLIALSAELEQHDVLAAMAGDPQAQAVVRATKAAVQPQYVVVDTDADQHAVIAAAAGGGHLRVDAPPGTGRTQAVAGIVAELVGRGRRVLVVGQKRATLTDLVGRLDSVRLSDVVLDPDRIAPADAVAQVSDTVRALADAPYRELSPGDDVAATLGAELDAYRDAVHRPREPWGSSAYEAMVVMATTSAPAVTSARIAPERLSAHLEGAAVRSQLREYAELGGLVPDSKGSPWRGADVPTENVAAALLATVVRLREHDVPALRDAATRAAVEVGLAGPKTIADCMATVELLADVASTIAAFGPSLWSEPLDDFVAATATRAWRSEHKSSLGFLARRRLRARIRELATDHHDRAATHQQLIAARDQLLAWRERARDSKPPRTGAHFPAAAKAAEAVAERLAVLIEANPRCSDLGEIPFAEATRRLTELIAAEPHLRSLPRLRELRAHLEAAGLAAVLTDLQARSLPSNAVEAVYDYARQASLLDLWRESDATLRDFDRTAHEQRRAAFGAADLAVIRQGADRVLAGRAARFAEVAEEFEGQTAVLLSASSDDRPRTARKLVETEPDVSLAAVPCWVMSPFAVAAALPPRRLFDTVIIEDAGQLAAAHAVPAIARAGQVILVGDEEVALDSFSTAFEPPRDPDELDVRHDAQPEPSVVDLLRDVMPTLSLTGQHRVRDDRLVGFAALTTYAGRLTPVPGVGGPDRLTIELVDDASGGDDPIDSSSAEVNRVVELVLDHVRSRPHESLGVVTLGARHAARLDTALRHALVRAADVAGCLREDRAEPFFIKDVDSVAGDVRDAIILSLGYGRSVDGRLLYRFGELDRPGGERRLTVATTRARDRFTVVSTFGSDDLSQRRLTTPGAQALGSFLAYVEKGELPATDSADHGSTPDPLAEAVAERLREAGATVVLGHGGPTGVTVAVRHPARRDRLVLAVETDGPAYAARREARERDRLRPAALQRMGWNVHHVWSAAWVADSEGETQRLLDAYEQAVADADAYDWAVAAAEADIVAGMPNDPPEAAAEADVVADSPDQDDNQEAGGSEPTDVDEPQRPARIGPRPPLVAGIPLTDYTGRELAALARWIESDGVARPVTDVVGMIADELALPSTEARTRDVLSHAVRVARAGAPAR